ncbi:hypothetical protein EDD76_10176 [Kineothrix alysoides]|jgi:DNA repair exonuclease SbcCD ATPase subunit|uniref:DUF5082 domain-containing protein n=1 Tax=Kineothrix alysoides TaxID=1469948 RepID=A0A4R1R690_9FIRM|nr:hypothetical protein [Kineothrix alysoides]TCL60979.1 hypothetical protein EDD76_10176 [Kineothrix alysoides]
MSEESERRRREREREERRARIRSQISNLNAKISSVRSLVSSFTSANAELAACQSDWGSAYSAYQGNQMASDVFVTDKFEGDTAEKLSADIPEVLKNMTHTRVIVGNVRASISNQIQKLQMYISKLESQVSALYVELNNV